RLDDGFPEGVARLRNAALAVDAEGDAVDGRAGLEEGPESVPGVGGVVGVGESLDRVVDAQIPGPLVAVGPEAELEMEPARRGGVADEAEGLQVPGPLLVRQAGGPDVIAGGRDQERIGEVEVRVADLAEEVVADPEGQMEAVEALRGEHGEIPLPERAVVEP